LLREALDVALEHDLVSAALRAYNNLLVILIQLDRPQETRRIEIEALELGRRRGNRNFVISFGGFRSLSLLAEGNWDEAFALGEEWLPTKPTAQPVQGFFTNRLAWAAFERGDDDEARRLLDLLAPGLDETADLQLREVLATKRMLLAIADRRIEDVVAAAGETARLDAGMRKLNQTAHTIGVALDALQPTGEVSDLLPLIDLADAAPAGERARQLDADVSRIRGVAASLTGDHDQAADHFGRALSAARNLGELLWIARVLADYATALVRAGRLDEAEPLAVEARMLFEGMGAVRAMERLDVAIPARVTA
jgi:tetratricopeptide (TPR) repeat protein